MTLPQYLEQVRARLEAATPDEHRFTKTLNLFIEQRNTDIAKLLRIIEVQREALEKANLAAAPNARGQTKRTWASDVLGATFDAMAEVDAIAGEGE